RVVERLLEAGNELVELLLVNFGHCEQEDEESEEERHHVAVGREPPAGVVTLPASVLHAAASALAEPSWLSRRPRWPTRRDGSRYPSSRSTRMRGLIPAWMARTPSRTIFMTAISVSWRRVSREATGMNT